MKIHDISIPLSEEMSIYPGDSEFKIERSSKVAEEKTVNISKITLGTHSGTHIDPPLHFYNDSNSVDKIPMDQLVGKAEVLDLSSLKTMITKGDLKKFENEINRNKIILLKTKNSKLWDRREFQKDYVYLSEDASQFLVKKKVKAVGIDYLSIEKFRSKTSPTHHLLLKNRITIIEGLNLTGILPGEYFLVCLPLKIKDGDGAPARAILIEDL